MIKATFFKDSKGNHLGFSILGHSGYAEYGSDIICASVSALSINTVNSIEHFTSDKFNVETDEDSGLLSFNFLSPVSVESKLLLDSLILGLQGIEESYNDKNYLKILFKEV